MPHRIIAEYAKLKKNHRDALRHRMARVTLGASVVRVFEPGTKDRLLTVLAGLPIEELTGVHTDDDFKMWFERQLDIVARRINTTNSKNTRVQPGSKWGHATKILTIYLREMVSHTHYFDDAQAARIEPFLFVPIDRITIESLKRLGHRPREFKRIKEIDTAKKFYEVQKLLGDAAMTTKTPRVWFDDGWGDREG